MITSQTSLKKIRDYWYEKLKDEGFDDIEDTNSPNEMLKTWSYAFFRLQAQNSFDYFNFRQDFYSYLDQLLTRFKFKSVYHERIIELRSNGLSLREISRALKLEFGEAPKGYYGFAKEFIAKTIQEIMEEDKKTQLLVREFKSEDLNFIKATWLNSIFYGSETFKHIPKSTFMHHYSPLLEKIILGDLNVPANKIFVACLKDDEDAIIGYTVHNGDNTLHFVYVKEDFRRIGVGTILLETLPNPQYSTHFIEASKNRFKHLTFNPFIIWETYLHDSQRDL